jgi:hypothetical protein
MPVDQLDAVQLHELARDPDRPPPRAFSDANDAVADAERAYRDAVRARHELIREARRLGVSWVALSRWTGISARTLHDIANTRTEDDPKP